MPYADVELLRYRSLSDINGEDSLTPAQACVPCQFVEAGFSMLKLSKARLTVGDSVTVYWDIHDNCSANDWIGLFDLDIPTSLTNYLDCKQRGVTGARRGAIKWVISRNIELNKVENRCIFKYIYANTGSVRAISSTIFVHNPYAEIQGSGGRHQANVAQDPLNEISVSGLSAFGLKKNIFGKPSPYVKLSVIPSRRHFRSWKHHHGQIAKTSSQSHTIDPNWQNEEFVFVGSNDDVLEIEVRNKFSGTRPAFSRFLGKLSVPLNDFVHEGRGTESVINKTLCKRTPSDRIQGRIRCVIAPLNTTNITSNNEEARSAGRENRRPSDLNVMPTHGGVMSNPALRSSAPDLLRPSHDESPSTPTERHPGSPVSPFSVDDNEPPTVNRRRNLPREMRPFSEFYSEEFVPLDPDISTGRTITPSEMSEEMREETPSGAIASIEEDDDDNVEAMAVVENGDAEPGEQSEETDPSSAPRARLPDEAVDETPITNEEQHESQDSLDELLQSDGEDINEDDDVSNQGSQELVNSVSSTRASTGSIELTEDSPLRILEESEQALDEEATFSPPHLEDSDEMDEEGAEEEGGAYGGYSNPNDGDDEMESERSTPDEDSQCITIISVDSWAYEQNGSANEAGPSGLSPPRYSKTNASEDIDSNEGGDQGDQSPLSRSQDEISLPLEDNGALTDDTDSLIATESIQVSEDILSNIRISPILSQVEYSESATPSLQASIQELDNVEQVEQDDPVNQIASVSSLDAEARNKVSHKKDKASPRAVVTLVTENQRLDLSSVAFPMDENEPDCMDFTSIQNSSASQMVMDAHSNRAESQVSARSSRSESLVNARSNRSESLVDTRTSRSKSLVDTTSHRIEHEVDARSSHSESPVNVRSNRSESLVDARTSRSKSLVDTTSHRIEPEVDARSSHSESPVSARSNRTQSQTDTRFNRSESLVESRSNRKESLDTRSNRSQSLIDSRLNDAGPSRIEPNVETRSNRRPPAIVSFSRSDDYRSSTRSEGQVAFVESVPIRPARRSKQLARSMSDTRATRLNHRPERPERSRRKRTETEPRASVRHQASEPYHPATLSDPVVVAVPISSDSQRQQLDTSQEAIFVAMASSSTSVTPLPSPTLDSDTSRSRESDEVVALPVVSTESSETRAVLAAVSSPRETTTVMPVPSPTAEQASVNWNETDRQVEDTHSLPSPSTSPAPSTSQTPTSAETGAIPKPSSQPELNRENISKMLRTYVRSAQTPQRPSQTEEPRYRREEDSDASLSSTHSRGRPPKHEAAEPSSADLPPRPPSHHTAVSSRRRSSRQQRQREERSQHERDTNPVHLQIQDSESRHRRATDNGPLPANWERGVDSHGRVYYIDHANRTTTWTRPTLETPQNETNMNDINTHWQSLDRRYESFRRTLRGRNRQSRPPLPDTTNQSNEGTPTSTNTDNTPRSRQTSVRSESLPQPTPPASTPTAVTPSSVTPSSVTPSSVTPSSVTPSSVTPSLVAPSTPGSSSTPSSSRSSHAGATSSRSSRSGMSSSARSAALLVSPAVKFISRPDFLEFIKNSGVAGQYYFQSQMLKLIISKVRADPANFEKYRHQVELVRFLNQFADPQIELPPAWDKKVDQNGRLYFIDHNTRTTTFIDPRLPHTGTTRRHRTGTETEPRRPRHPPPRPPPPRGHSRNNSDVPALSYNQQVVGFLSQPNIDDTMSRKYPGFARNMALKANIRRVKNDGERALERLSNNVDFVMLLSMFEDQIMSFVPPEVAAQKCDPTSPPTSLPSSPVRAPVNRKSATELTVKGSGGASSSAAPPAPYRRDFEAKVRSFHRQLYHKGYGQGPNKIKMAIRRDRLLEDAYDQIMKETARSLQRNRLEISFAGEEGLDYGGPAREFFFLISRQIFNPYYGLFEYSANDTYTVQVSPVSLYVDNSHEWFRFCGRLVGLVIIHQHLLDAFFTRTYYKSLLRSPCDLSDVESLDALFHQSMTWVIENNIEDVLDLTFTVSEEIFGQVSERELIPGGTNIAVTEENKSEYVNEMVKWRVERGVSEQIESIVRGFNEVIDPNLVSIFDARELELVISGTADIDIKDWRRHTEYRSGYHDSHKVVKWFWKAVTSLDNEQKLRLLQFVTGTSSIPYEGFAALRGSTGPRKFSIERWGDFSKLPRAHTCFNRLDLPVYRSYEELLEKLTYAVEETGTFSIQ